VLLDGINTSTDNYKTFGIDRLAVPASGYITTYGIDNEYNFTTAH